MNIPKWLLRQTFVAMYDADCKIFTVTIRSKTKGKVVTGVGATVTEAARAARYGQYGNLLDLTPEQRHKRKS